MPEGVVIIGGGQAGGVAAAGLREQGYAGAITLVAEEPCLPYQRPPLSKNYLAGQMSAQQVLLKQAAFYSEKAIDVMVGREVTELSGRRRW